MIYNLSNRGSVPLYEFLYKSIKADILNGKLRADEKLPSKREMANNHGISVVTVENAYEQLSVEGYIYAVEKKGYFVNDIEKSDSIVSAKKSKTKLEAEKKKEWLVDFSSNHIVYDNFPFSTWSKILRKTIADRELDFLNSPEHNGVWELRSAISNHLENFRGMNVNPNNIIIGAGMEYLYGLLVQLLGKSKTIAVEDPGHKKVGQIYVSHGVKCIPIPVNEDGIDIEKLQGCGAKTVHVSPSHHFPTGCVMPISRRTKLLDWAKDVKGYVVEDDYDSEFRFQGRPIPTLQSINPDRVIYMNTFSKTLASSIRIAYMILPDKLMEKFKEKLSFYASTVSGFEQYTLAKFISDGYYGRHINRMRNYYRNYRKTIIDELMASPMKKQISIEEASSGLHFILKIETDIDDEKFIENLKNNGINISPVSKYCYHKSNKFKHKFIINYSAVEEKKLKKAFKIMSESLENQLPKATKGKLEKKNMNYQGDKQFHIEMPKSVKRIISILEDEGFEAFAVGGCVRDVILDRDPNDWDITTSAYPEDVKRIFNRTFDTGLKHGTVTVRMGGKSYEVTTYRIDGDYKDSRHPESVSFTSDLREDLKRRDFTINAMAYNETMGLVDEFDGRADIENKIIRCVGNPKARFSEDALRILRAIRFAAQLGFDIDEVTKEAMKLLAPTLKNISAERIQTELEKLILSDHPEMLIEAYKLGITKVILPEFDELMECEQNSKYHYLNVGEHTAEVMKNVRSDKLLRWTALLHDIAKPETKSMDENGRGHFHGHGEEGVKKAREIMRRLKMDNKTIKNVGRLIEYHDYRPRPLEPETVRRCVNLIGKDLYGDMLELIYADLQGKSEYAREINEEMYNYFKEEYEKIKKNNVATSKGEMNISGQDLIDMGFEPGEKIGEVLDILLDKILENPEMNTKEKLMKEARKLL